MQYKIEKGVDPPLTAGSNSRWRELRESLEVGDSVVLPYRVGESFIYAMISYAKRHNLPHKYTRLRLDGTDDVRIWRIK